MDELWPKNERNIDDEGVEHIWIQLTHMWIISHGWNYKWMKMIKSFIFVYMCEAYIPTSIPLWTNYLSVASWPSGEVIFNLFLPLFYKTYFISVKMVKNIMWKCENGFSLLPVNVFLEKKKCM